ncbi:MAG: hypothetical protein ACXU7D_09780 [Burkholderiaceae bacterium]
MGQTTIISRLVNNNRGQSPITINWEADANFGDPAYVADPACWISKNEGDALWGGF